MRDRAAATAIAPAPAFTAAQLSAYPGADWLTTGGGLTDNRYSALTQINRANVSGLKQAWESHFGLPTKTIQSISEEASPIVEGGVLYVPDGLSNVYAFDAQTGQKLWTYNPELTSLPLIPADRGLAVGDGRIYSAQVDGTLTALDQTTGKPVWSTPVGHSDEGYAFSAPPVYYNGLVIAGMSGGDWAARSFAVALDARTGREVWRWYVVPSPGELGSGTWPLNLEWMHPGGAIWIYPSIDPAAGLLYLVTGNPIPWNGRGPGADLWTDSIVALHVDDGQFAWGFQTVHHDIWDYDVTNPPVLFDSTINGQAVHGIATASKTGWVYILDRFTGKPLLPIVETKMRTFKNPVQRDYANLSGTQPIPQGDAFVNQCSKRAWWKGKAPDGKRFKVGCIFTPYAVDAKHGSFLASTPSAEGGVDWPPSAYNPDTHFEYVCARDGAGSALGAIPRNQIKVVPGKLSLGVNFGATSKVLKDFGRVVAMDVTTNRIAWNVKWDEAPCFSGVMTTAGGLVFVGRADQGLVSYDATNGTQLWSSGKLGGGVNAPAVTYTVGGKQYVAVLAGGNALAKGTPSDAVVAFALP